MNDHAAACWEVSSYHTMDTARLRLWGVPDIVIWQGSVIWLTCIEHGEVVRFNHVRKIKTVSHFPSTKTAS